MRSAWLLVVSAMALPIGGAGCDRSGDASDGIEVTAIPAARPAALTPLQQRERRTHARALFASECAGCHGERGRGDGPAADVLTDPAPRDLVTEKFKLRSTPAGSPPLPQDIYETITRGIPGTGMPSFAFLQEDERWLLVDYVRELSGIDQLDEEPEVIRLGDQPAGGPEAVTRGRAVYEKLQCNACHGAGGKGDGPSAATLKDPSGRPAKVRDLTAGVFRRGETVPELHMRFVTGLDGSPMPSYDGTMTEQEGWDLAYFIASLPAAKAPAPQDPVERGRLVVETHRCDGCHVIEGKGGRVGPSLDVAAQKLQYAWAREFLANPRPYGKIYPYIPYRMPHLDLAATEIDDVLSLFAKIADRPYPEPAGAGRPKLSVPPERVNEGLLIYAVKCAECHNLGNVVWQPEAKRQGPELIELTNRVRYDWIADWVEDPKAISPHTPMIDTNLTREEIEKVRDFLWTVSTDVQEKERAKANAAKDKP